MTIVNKIHIKKLLSFLIAIMTIASSFSLGTIDAQAAQWKTGCFAGKKYTAGTTIYLSNVKKDAKINFYTYKKDWKGIGKNCKSHIDIIMKDKNGKIIWSGTKVVGTNGITLKLGKDHSAYVLYFKEHTPGDATKNPDDYNPQYKSPDYWGIKYTSNCK